MLGIEADNPLLAGHHAPGDIVLCSLAFCTPWLASNSLDAVICALSFRYGPLTNGISEGHVGAKRA